MEKVAENSPTRQLLSKEAKFVLLCCISSTYRTALTASQDRSELQAAPGISHCILASQACPVPAKPGAELGSRREAGREAQAGAGRGRVNNMLNIPEPDDPITKHDSEWGKEVLKHTRPA